MSEQEQDLPPAMQEVLAQMARMQADLTELKQRTKNVTLPEQRLKPVASVTRRNTLKRLGLALFGGAITVTALGAASVVQARIIANPQTNNLANRAGLVVIPPGAAAPVNFSPDYTYGLIASANTTALKINMLPGNTGVYGVANAPGENVYGVYGSGGTYGVYGIGEPCGVFGKGTSVAVQGSGVTYGVYGSSSNIGMYASGSTYGLYGTGINYGLYGVGTSYGVSGTGDIGVFGAGNSYGVYGAGSNYAGYFAGNVDVLGTLSKGGGAFKIDHPLDPANQFLYHSFVESPDMMNIYNGVVKLNDQGEASVEMPSWFEALNSDFRYQLTSIGKSMPGLFIAEKMTGLKFKIAGGLKGQEVSWQVTGIRQDEWAKAHRIPVEEAKKSHERGKYLHPELFGQPEEMSLGKPPVAAK